MKEAGQKNAVLATMLKHCFIVALCIMVFTNKLDAQNLTLKFSNVPVKTALKAIEKQTDYSFVYSNSVDVEKIISVDVENQELKPILNGLFSEAAIVYQINGKQIILSPAATAGVSKSGQAAPVSAGTKNVTGVVRDDAGLPLEGASVVVKNKDQYTLTGSSGEFSLSDVDPADMLTVFFVGFEPANLHVGSASSFDVKMASDAAMLDGALVTGYTTLSRERATGAFNRVGSEVISQRRASDLSSALLGTVAGMQGKENADGTVNYIIRGTTSLYADAAPLVVVDGFPVANGFRDVNPNDVENITILKDAAAASIWGARSANGVIVVTTKKASIGGSGQGKNININVNTMVKIGDKLDLETILTTASSEDHVFYEMLAFNNNWIFSSGYVDNFSTSILNAPMTLVSEQVYKFRAGKITEAEMTARVNELRHTNNRQQIKDLLLQRPILQQYNLTVTNSNNNIRNYLSALYEHGKGNVVENHNDRWRINYNNQVKVFKWLDFSLATNLHLLRNTTSGPTVTEMRELSPYEMILNEDGSYAEQLKINREQRAKIPEGQLPYEDWTYNILREARARDYSSEQFNTRVQAGLTFKLMEGLKFASSIQYEYNKTEAKELNLEDSFYTRNYVNTWIDYTHVESDYSQSKRNKQLVPKGAILKAQRSTRENYVWRNQLDFDRIFGGNHQVAAAAGFEMQEYKTNSQSDPWVFGYNPDKNSSALINLNPSAPQEKDIKGSVPYYTFPGSGGRLLPAFGYRLDRYVSVYGNASYTFAGKYSITGSARSDASNLIADDPAYRWAPLWSVGGKWNVSQESFMQTTSSWLDRLALRLTYGFNGNVEKSTSHKTLIGRSTAPSITFGGFYTGSITQGNPDLRWEKTSSVNAAVDFALFNNMLFGSIDIYNKQGKDIIGNKVLPSLLGASSRRINNAKISNKGVEIEVGVNTKITEEVRFTGKLTYAYNSNEITYLHDPNNYAYAMIEGAYVEGYPVGALWGYKYLGMNNGVPYVEGIGGLPSTMNDVAIHNRALGSLFLKYAGPGIAPHTMGLHAGFSGYGFSVSVFMNGTFGGHFRNPTFNYNMVGSSKVVIPYFVNEVINGSNKLPGFPVVNETKTYLWDRYVPNLLTMIESSSFVKIKEVNLEYSLPKRWTDYVGIGSTRVFAQIRDLGCIYTANSRGYDPEWLPGTMKPATTYAFGVNLNF